MDLAEGLGEDLPILVKVDGIGREALGNVSILLFSFLLLVYPEVHRQEGTYSSRGSNLATGAVHSSWWGW